ncbi:hypothetical protein GGF46_002271 [Coemansia sp. RSA 552]|nr:hypothetical protein GGF46_002271 [Coemansia sp. RSA 552]
MFEWVPPEVLVLILGRLGACDLIEAGRVCRTWRAAAEDDASWRQAVQCAFGRRPFERLDARRMPSTDGSAWIEAEPDRSTAWRSELVGRLRLRLAWSDARRLSFGPRTGSVDALVVSEQNMWALVISKAAGAAVRCWPRTGKSDVRDAILAYQYGGAATAAAGRIDRVAWGSGSGVSTVTHITRGGVLRQRVVAEQTMPHRVTAVAGPYDALAQDVFEWRAMYGVVGDDAIASATSGGSVLVWSARTGATLHELHAARAAPLTQVAWAEGGRYVAAASEEAGRVFVWDLEQSPDPDPENKPEQEQDPADEYPGARRPSVEFTVQGGARVVQLVGDPFGAAFIVTTEAGAWRVAQDGRILAAFATGEARVTAAEWNVGAGRGQRALPATRVLVVGDATGCLWLFDGDGTGVPMQRLMSAHAMAVSAISSNSAVIMSGSRDGLVCVTEMLSGRILNSAHCRGGRSWAIHDRLMSTEAEQARSRAQALYSRPQALWDSQIAPGGVDSLEHTDHDDGRHRLADRDPVRQLHAGMRNPSIITALRAGYGWGMAAGCAHIHAVFALPPPPKTPSRPSLRTRDTPKTRIAEALTAARHESTAARSRRIAAADARSYVEREFEAPLRDLGLTEDEQLAYALSRSTADPTLGLPEDPTLGLTEDEQLELALRLSRSSS